MILQDAMQYFSQTTISGGLHTAPSLRLLLFALAKSIDAQTIIETGYDNGLTTEALAMTGANIIAIDDHSEYPEAKQEAHERLTSYPNVTIKVMDALEYLETVETESVDLIFIDDLHDPNHVRDECIEVDRILKPGGIAAFHDTIYIPSLWIAIDDILTDWQKVNLSNFHRDLNYGFCIAVKPVGQLVVRMLR